MDVWARVPWLPTEALRRVPLPIHDRYSFPARLTPTICIEELLAEKLARFRRVSLARDLYDLFWFSTRPFDEATVRRLTVLKVWWDVTHEGRGIRPFDPEAVLAVRSATEFRQEQIGLLTVPIDMPRWVQRVSDRYRFLRHLDDVEQRIAACSLRDEPEVLRLIRAYA